MPTPRFKFGLKRSKPDPRRLKFARYLLPGLPPPPPSADWTPKVPGWTVMANDRLGDCVIAAGGHSVVTWTANAKGLVVPTDADIITAYSACTGYDPSQTDVEGNNPTDQGTDPDTFLKFWRDVGIAGHKIGAWAALDPHQPDQFRHAIDMFGLAFIAVELPTNFSFDWTAWTDTDAEPDPEAGHGVMSPVYSPDGEPVVTWGMLMPVSWPFLARYCIEAYAIFSTDFIAGNGLSPSGFDPVTLAADLALVTA